MACEYGQQGSWSYQRNRVYVKLTLVLFKYGVPLSDPCAFPLGFMYVSAALKRIGHEVKVLNYNLHDYDFEKEIEGQDAVFFTGFEDFLPQIKEHAAICKGKGIKTILGGALATFSADAMLEIVDTVVVGEAEDVIDRALEMSGIFKKGFSPDLETLPLPDYEGFGIREYHKRNGFKHIGVLTSRGCPWSCKFCAHTCSYQCRNLDNVFEEIDLYTEKYGVGTIVFNDNTLNASKSRFMQICNGMAPRKPEWCAAIRLDRLDEEMALKAKSSGAKYFVVGVESFKQEKLDMMHKQITVDQICKGLDLLHKHKIPYHGNILMGWPEETAEDILSEVRSIPSGYNIFPVLVQPFVGTNTGQRTISKDEEKLFSDSFRAMVESRGMYMYPDVNA